LRICEIGGSGGADDRPEERSSRARLAHEFRSASCCIRYRRRAAVEGADHRTPFDRMSNSTRMPLKPRRVRLRAKRSYNDTALVARQSKQFRQYLELLFADRKPAE
jgi:hypothetical protein